MLQIQRTSLRRLPSNDESPCRLNLTVTMVHTVFNMLEMWKKKKKIWFSHSIKCADLCVTKILVWHTPVLKCYNPKPCLFSTLETQKNNNLVNLSQYVPHLSIMWSPRALINTSLIMAIFVHTAKIKFRFWHFIKRTTNDLFMNCSGGV